MQRCVDRQLDRTWKNKIARKDSVEYLKCFIVDGLV
jgi:hypothetical protein